MGEYHETDENKKRLNWESNAGLRLFHRMGLPETIDGGMKKRKSVKSKSCFTEQGEPKKKGTLIQDD